MISSMVWRASVPGNFLRGMWIGLFFCVMVLAGCNEALFTHGLVDADPSTLDLSPYLGVWTIEDMPKGLIEVPVEYHIRAHPTECAALVFSCLANQKVVYEELVYLSRLSIAGKEATVASVKSRRGDYDYQICEVRLIDEAIRIYRLSPTKVRTALEAVPPLLEGHIEEIDDNDAIFYVTSDSTTVKSFLESTPDIFDALPSIGLVRVQ